MSSRSFEDFIESCSLVIDFPVAWGEMDAYQHVNSVHYFKYFENARAAYFLKIGVREVFQETAIGTVVSKIDCSYRLPLKYPDHLYAGTKVTNIMDDRFTMENYLFSKTHQKIAAQGTCYVVMFDFKKNQKASIPEKLLVSMQSLEQGKLSLEDFLKAS